MSPVTATCPAPASLSTSTSHDLVPPPPLPSSDLWLGVMRQGSDERTAQQTVAWAWCTSGIAAEGS